MNGHISGRPFLSRRLKLTADYVVVGSGAGGATAATHLAERGADVILVEAGTWRDPEHYPQTTFGGMRDLMDGFGATITMGRAFWPVVQARTVGGTTVINSAIAVRTPDDIFDLWAERFGIHSQQFRTELLRFQDQLDEELSVEEARPETRGRTNELAMKGARAMGIEGHWMKRYIDDCEGSGFCMTGCRKGRKQSLNVAFVPRMMAAGGRMLSNAPAKRVLFDGQRAVGVEGRFIDPITRRRGGRYRIRALRGVIVAASATHSPCLLQRSGLKSPALGSGFRAHPGTGVFGVYDDPVDMNLGNTQGWASMHYRDDKRLKLETLSIPPEMVMTRLKGGGREYMERLAEMRHLAMWVHALRADSAGSVRNGPGDSPIVRYTLDRADMARFREGMATVARLHFAAGAKAVIPGIHGLPYKLGPDQVDAIENAPLDPRNYLAILSHLFGGCTMGTDPRASVCDPLGRVHGHQSLYIADASMIPSVLGVNPQHTIMSLARWVTSHLDV